MSVNALQTILIKMLYSDAFKTSTPHSLSDIHACCQNLMQIIQIFEKNASSLVTRSDAHFKSLHLQNHSADYTQVRVIHGRLWYISLAILMVQKVLKRSTFKISWIA